MALRRLTDARRAEARERTLKDRIALLERLVMSLAGKLATASEHLTRLAERRTPCPSPTK